MNIPVTTKTAKKKSYMDELRGNRMTMVTHYRYVNENGTIRLLPLYVICKENKQRDMLPNGGAVKVIISEKDTNWIGYSYCALEDRFTKRSGNIMAFRNALQKLSSKKLTNMYAETHSKNTLQKIKRRLPKQYVEELTTSEIHKDEESD